MAKNLSFEAISESIKAINATIPKEMEELKSSGTEYTGTLPNGEKSGNFLYSIGNQVVAKIPFRENSKGETVAIDFSGFDTDAIRGYAEQEWVGRAMKSADLSLLRPELRKVVEKYYPDPQLTQANIARQKTGQDLFKRLDDGNFEKTGNFADNISDVLRPVTPTGSSEPFVPPTVITSQTARTETIDNLAKLQEFQDLANISTK